MSARVVGFAMDRSDRIALAQRDGVLTGVGGVVGKGEAVVDAMIREFEAKTTVRVVTDWQPLVKMEDGEDVVYFFRAFIDAARLNSCRRGHQPVTVLPIQSLSRYQAMPSLSWLVPLAAYTADNYESILIKIRA